MTDDMMERTLRRGKWFVAYEADMWTWQFGVGVCLWGGVELALWLGPLFISGGRNV